MPYYIVQAGTTLKRMSPAGVLTSLTLPTDIAVSSSRRMRGAVMGNMLTVVNAPTENLTIDRYNNVRLLVPGAPTSAPVLSGTGSGGLSGSFKVRVTFFVKDSFGNIVAESGFGPESAASGTITGKQLTADNIPLSSQVGVTGRRLYRTTTGPGSVYFPWIDVDGNTVTSVSNDMADAAMSTVAAPDDLGYLSRATLISEFSNRLWAVTADDIDALRYSGNGRIYAWGAAQSLPIPPQKRDAVGITALIRRRDELGVGKRNGFHKISGDSEDNFTRYTVAEEIGVWAPDSVCVIRDIGYFLGNPFGIYAWGPNGIENISDEKVKGWFARDTYFNRAQFVNAIGAFDPTLNSYVVLLCSAGSSALDRWIQYDLNTKTWWGPHKTDALTLTYVASLLDADSIEYLAFGASNGKIYSPQSTKADVSTAIDMDVYTSFLSGNTPTVMKYWGRPEIVSIIDDDGGILRITPQMDGPDDNPQPPLVHDLRTGGETLDRLGVGKAVQLRLQQNGLNEDVTIEGIELPFHELGNRSQ